MRAAHSKQFQKFLTRDFRLFEDIAHVSRRQVARVHRDRRPSRAIVIVEQKMVASLHAIDMETRALQGGDHLARRDLRKPAHARASFTGINSLIVPRGAASEAGSGQPLSR
jgi:hypothetical protein